MNYNYKQPDGGRVVRSLKGPAHYAHPQTPRRKSNHGTGASNFQRSQKKWHNLHGDQRHSFKDGYYDVSTEEGHLQHRNAREELLKQLKAQFDASQVPLAQMPGGHHNLRPTPRYRNGVPYKERKPGMATGPRRYNVYDGSREAQIQRYGAPLAVSTKSPQQRRAYAEGRDAYDRKFKQGKYNV